MCHLPLFTNHSTSELNCTYCSYLVCKSEMRGKMCFQSEQLTSMQWIFTTTAFIFSILETYYSNCIYKELISNWKEKGWTKMQQGRRKNPAIWALSSKCHERSSLWEWALTPQDDSFGKYAGLLTTKRGLQYDKGNNMGFFRLWNRLLQLINVWLMLLAGKYCNKLRENKNK